MQEPALYIQHPQAHALEIKPHESDERGNVKLPLGLICPSDEPYTTGQLVDLSDPQYPDLPAVVACVLWCRRQKSGFQLGLGFRSEEELYRARMFEQLCHIKHYQKEERAQGRRISQEHAAVEWISKYASHFPTDGL